MARRRRPPAGGRFSARAAATGGLVAAALLIGACGGGSAPAAAIDAGGCAGGQLRPAPANATAVEAATLCLLNAERRRRGLGPLLPDGALRAAAVAHSLDMARRDYFEHDTPEGVKPWMRIARTGYRSSLVGENLAWGEGAKSTPAHALKLWMASPGHRENLLEPRYTQVGIGLAFDAPDPDPTGRSAAVYTTTFGSAAVSLR